MGLPKVTRGNKYTAMLLTFGPYRPEDKHAARILLKGMVQRRVNHLKENQLIIAFEEGERKGKDGYFHCHIAIGLSRDSKPPMTLLKECKLMAKLDEEGRKPNGSIHYVPIDSRHQRLASALGRFGVLRKYLTDPHKTKMTDDDCLEFVLTVEDEMKTLEAELDRTMFRSKEYQRIHQAICMLRLKQQLFAARENERLWREKHGIPHPDDGF